jgi:hypothetical protein
MSLSRTLQINKTVEVNGDSHEFCLLDIYDIAKIDEARKASLKTVAKANANEAGLTKSDIYNIVMDIDARDFSLNEILGYVTTPKGASDTLERSLVKAGKTKDEAKAIIGKMENVDSINLAQQLMLLPRKKEEAKIEDPNAGTAEVSTQKTPPNDSGSSEVSQPTISTPTPVGKSDKKQKETLCFGD